MTQFGFQKVGWLVNDCLTTIPGTTTFWHDLLEWFPDLEDKTGGYTKFDYLADKIEKDAEENGPPDYIIRNATYFRKLHIKTKQITLLQDHFDDGKRISQLEVCNRSTMTVFNSEFTCDSYKERMNGPYRVIPLGTDFDFFCPSDSRKIYDIVYVGDSKINPKGFDIILSLIEKTKYKFALVMKDDFSASHPRVKVFNKIDHNALRYILRRSKVLLCTSKVETLHLAGVEAMACNVPIVATSVGIYKEFIKAGSWGVRVDSKSCDAFIETLDYVMSNYSWFKPRQYAFDMRLDKFSCKRKWIQMIEQLLA